MATKRVMTACLSRLRLMRAGNDQAWTDDSTPIFEAEYIDVMRHWDDELAVRVVNHARNHLAWRPSRAELNDLAARFCEQLPTEGQAWSEFYHKVVCYEYRIPTFTHPILDDIAVALGGW